MLEKYVCNSEVSLGVADMVGSVDSIVSKYMEKNFFKPVKGGSPPPTHIF